MIPKMIVAIISFDNDSQVLMEDEDDFKDDEDLGTEDLSEHNFMLLKMMESCFQSIFQITLSIIWKFSHFPSRNLFTPSEDFGKGHGNAATIRIRSWFGIT